MRDLFVTSSAPFVTYDVVTSCDLVVTAWAPLYARCIGLVRALQAARQITTR